MEIVLSITPRLIRNIQRPDASLADFRAGTDSTLRKRPDYLNLRAINRRWDSIPGLIKLNRLDICLTIEGHINPAMVIDQRGRTPSKALYVHICRGGSFLVNAERNTMNQRRDG
jgi:hypothetical protein